MDSHIKKVYVPMTETGFYILLCLRKEAHGYHIVKEVEALTKGAVVITRERFMVVCRRWRRMA